MKALAANGANVIDLARSFASAKAACEQVGRHATPVACDLADFVSVNRAVQTTRDLDVPLDALVATAGVAILVANHLGTSPLEIARDIRVKLPTQPAVSFLTALLVTAA
jgi:NADP-dependent 3-hydroxy acid dehydrogenase YdfG